MMSATDTANDRAILIPATQDVFVFMIGRSNERARTSNNRVRRRIKRLFRIDVIEDMTTDFNLLDSL